MINQQLVDYVKQQVQAGISKDAVRKALGDAGWPAADIDDSMKVAEPAAPVQPAGVAASPASQPTINPVVAMGGVESPKTVATSPSSSDKFFAKPAAAKASLDDESDEDHPQAKKFVIAMIAMGAVILLLAGALVFVYFNMNSQLEAALSGAPGSSDQVVSLQQQVAQLTTDKDGLATQIQTLGADNQTLLGELGFFASASSGASTTPVSATVKGTLLGNASTTFTLITSHNVKIVVANSKDAKVAAALTPLVASTSSVTLAGTHPPGSANLTVTSVNGTAL